MFIQHDIKITRCAKKPEDMTHNQEKSRLIEIALKIIQMIILLVKDLKYPLKIYSKI